MEENRYHDDDKDAWPANKTLFYLRQGVEDYIRQNNIEVSKAVVNDVFEKAYWAYVFHGSGQAASDFGRRYAQHMLSDISK